MNVNVLYESTVTGDMFFVQLNTEDFDSQEDLLTSADEIASEVCGNPRYVATVDDEEAEMLGYDTY